MNYIVTNANIIYNDLGDQISEQLPIKRLLAVIANGSNYPYPYIIYEDNTGNICNNNNICTKVEYINTVLHLIKYSETKVLLFGYRDDNRYAVVEYNCPIISINCSSIFLANGTIYQYCIDMNNVLATHNVIKVIGDLHIKSDGIYIRNSKIMLSKIINDSGYFTFTDIKDICQYQYILLNNGRLFQIMGITIVQIDCDIKDISWDYNTNTLMLHRKHIKIASRLINNTYYGATGAIITDVKQILGDNYKTVFNKNARN